MGLAHSEVIRRYAQGRPNKRTGKVEWHGRSVYAEDRAVYSYGSHFPMAYRLGVGLFLKNGDRYSSSTTGHQGEVQRHCSGPTVPFSALRRARIDPSGIRAENILDYTKDTYIDLIRDSKDSPWFEEVRNEVPVNEDEEWNFKNPDGQAFKTEKTRRPFTPPLVGMMIPGTPDAEGNVLRADWHILGAVLLRFEEDAWTEETREWIPGKDASHPIFSTGEYVSKFTEHPAQVRLLLCSTDEGNYFISELPSKVRTVAEAFDVLKPAEVKDAERRTVGGRTVLRQGEWFFIPSLLGRRELARYADAKTLTEFDSSVRQSALPVRSAQSNLHVVRNVSIPHLGIFTTGNVYHRNERGRRTRQHRTLRLGSDWYRAARNTEVASWSAEGRVD